MRPLIKDSTLGFATITMVALLSGCGGDGLNASDNPVSVLTVVASNGGTGGGSELPPLPERGAPRLLDTDDSGDVENSRAVVDNSGNVTLVWTQSDGVRINLWASRYRVGGGGWSNPQIIDNSAYDVKGFEVVVDPVGGDVMVAWGQLEADAYMSGAVQVNVERTDLWAAHYDVSALGWIKTKIDTQDLSAVVTEHIEDIGEFKVVVDGGGEFSVLWVQHTGSRYDLYARRNVAATWDAAPVLVDSDVGDVSAPQLLADSSGKLFALWSQASGAIFDLWGARYSAGVWSAATRLESEDLGSVEAPQAVVTGSGELTLAWRQFDGSFWNLWTKRYVGSWGVETKVELLSGDVRLPQLLLYSGAKVMLLWTQSDGVVNNVWSKRYDAGWSANGVITTGGGDSGSVTMVKEADGIVMAVWAQHSNSVVAPYNSLWANRFSAGSWGSAVLIETSDSGDVRSPSLMVDGSGRVSVVWLQDDNGRFDLWSNHYHVGLGGWGDAKLIERMDAGSAADPQVVMSSSGNITLVWRHPYDSSNHLVTNDYIAASGSWGTVNKVESAGESNGFSPQLLVDGSGIVTAIWLQPEVVNGVVRINLWGNRFQAGI